MPLAFRRYPTEFAVCRLPPHAPIPAWASSGTFLSITRTPNELSIVCQAHLVPPNVQAEPGWTCLELIGPFPFNLTGILASFLQPLAASRIPIFALSTFDTDWVLVPSAQIDSAVQALHAAGHNEICSPPARSPLPS